MKLTDDVRVTSQDAARYFSALEACEDKDDRERTSILRWDYLKGGSPALVRWATFRIAGRALVARRARAAGRHGLTPDEPVRLRTRHVRAMALDAAAEKMAQVIGAHPEFFSTMSWSVGRDEDLVSSVATDLLHRMQTIGGSCPPVFIYLLGGCLTSAATTWRRSIMVAVEMFGRGPDTATEGLPEPTRSVLRGRADLPFVLAHELVHTFQTTAVNSSVLALSVREGAADFIASTFCGIPESLERAHRRILPDEEDLWEAFVRRMEGSDGSGWLYDRSVRPGVPLDLGYFFGYRICETYLARRGRSKAALGEILVAREPLRLWRDSGYDPRGAAATAGIA